MYALVYSIKAFLWHPPSLCSIISYMGKETLSNCAGDTFIITAVTFVYAKYAPMYPYASGSEGVCLISAVIFSFVCV